MSSVFSNVRKYMIVTGPFRPLLCFVVYIVCFVLLLISSVLNLLKIPLVYDTVLVCVLLIHCVIEGYNDLVKYVSSSHLIEAFSSSSIQVTLIGSQDSMYFKSGKWEQLQKDMTPFENIQFVFYDTQNRDPNEISLLTSMNIERLRYIPAILIHSPGGLFLYDDNIYDIDKIEETLNKLVRKSFKN